MENSKKEYYINPYNFISLPEKRSNSKDYYDGKKITGYIKCRLKTVTPLFIPDTREKSIVKEKIGNSDKEHLKYKFFNYDDEKIENPKPIIPGSELRGMIRSDFEVFTNSCMSTLSDDINFISRTSSPKLPGILKKENGKWKLYKAKQYSINTRNHGKFFINKHNELEIGSKKYKTCDKINFTYKIQPIEKFGIKIGERYIVNEIIDEKNNGDNYKGNIASGILFIGEENFNKKYDSIFAYKSDYEDVDSEILENEIRKLKDIFDLYNDKAFNQKVRGTSKIWYEGYNFNCEELPIWYKLDDNGGVYLSLACIGKEAYHKRISDLVGDFMPCIGDNSGICKACYLFGYTSEDNSSSSKIRISDAKYIGNENPYGKTLILRELSTPHYSNPIFYGLLTPFEPILGDIDFNYDGYIIKGKYDKNNFNIKARGRKAYWHHWNESLATTKIKTDRNSSITPVKEEAEFEFKIYFENIFQEALDELIAILNLKYSDFEDKEKCHKLCHKLGKAKPLGLGSCEINVDEVKIRDVKLINDKIEYNMKSYEEYLNLDSNQKLNDVISLDSFDMSSISMKEALRIYDFNYIKNYYPNAKVTYPEGVDTTVDNIDRKQNSMNWFMFNKSLKVNDRFVRMVLPRIIDGAPTPLENKKSLKLDKGEYKFNGLLLPKYIKYTEQEFIKGKKKNVAKITIE